MKFINPLRTKSGREIYPIGIGTWEMGSVWNPDIRYAEAVYENNDRDVKAIQYSLSVGQNHIDTAEMYGAGHTDELVGEAIKGHKREDLYVANKLWKTSVGKGLVRSSVEKMLKRLQIDYLDMLYIHDAWEDSPWEEAMPQIDELIDEGIVRDFGVSNFNISEMKKAMKIAKHPLVANQLRFNILYKQEATKTVREFCRDHNIYIVAYRPIERKAIFESSQVLKMAKKNNVTPAQYSLAWLLHQGVYPIPKASTLTHIDDNLKAININFSNI